MTSIDFYTHVADPLEVAARLVAKAFAQHGRVRVLTPDAASTDALDRRLWVKPPIAFLPHCRVDSALAAQTPIWIDHSEEHPGPASVLINLRTTPPGFFARFERLAEIVGIGADNAAAGRERYRFYRERGYELRTHSLAEQ
jgi:DNA polymerase-3 subunit chi